MPSQRTLSKGVSATQADAFMEAARRAGLTKPDAIERAIAEFCQSQGVDWPPSEFEHGGSRMVVAISSGRFGLDVRRTLRWTEHRDLNTGECSREAEIAMPAATGGKLFLTFAQDTEGVVLRDARFWNPLEGIEAQNVVNEIEWSMA